MFSVSSWLLPSISLIALILGSITDIKKREVPDFLNFSLIAIGLSLGSIISLIQWSIWPILSSVSGFIFAYLLSALMYYTGQWGGGDAKMLMGLGALYGVSFFGPESFITTSQIPIFFTIIITILFAGAVYSVLYLFGLIFFNWKKFKINLVKKMKEKQIIKIKWFILSIVLISFLLAVFVSDLELRLIFAFISILTFVGFYMSIFMKVVEKSLMIKSISVNKLVLGDWIAKDVVVNKKIICGRKTLGLEQEHIDELKRLGVKKVFVKDGVPFIPGFLLGYLIVLIFGNWLPVVITYLF